MTPPKNICLGRGMELDWFVFIAAEETVDLMEVGPKNSVHPFSIT